MNMETQLRIDSVHMDEHMMSRSDIMDAHDQEALAIIVLAEHEGGSRRNVPEVTSCAV